MKFLNRNMGLTYTIMGGAFQIAAIICYILVYNADNGKNKTPSTSSSTFNINGDYINGNKKTNITRESDSKKDKVKENKQTQINQEHDPKLDKSQEMKEEEKSHINNAPSVNNGIINSGVNNGNQTVNNVYNGNAPRQLNSQDIEYIKQNIPIDYKIDFTYIFSTEESLKYSEQILSALTKMGYVINSTNAIGNLQDGIPTKTGERFRIDKYDSEKKVNIVIKEQR